MKNPKKRAKTSFGWLIEAVLYIVLPLASKGMVGRRNKNIFSNKDPGENHGVFSQFYNKEKNLLDISAIREPKQPEESVFGCVGFSSICRSDPRAVSMNTAPSDQIDRLKSLLAEFPILQVVSV